ncbi:hypothetical protein ABID59_001927 [Bradyrhizobium sp. S3.3.6]|uniref:hypothetical protein n=1 Tax=Bradyrhizobium sp. S3.3.6 TaxID=3156429 RepID=UPI0033956DC8
MARFYVLTIEPTVLCGGMRACDLVGLGPDFEQRLPELEIYLEGLVADGETSEDRLTVDGLTFLREEQWLDGNRDGEGGRAGRAWRCCAEDRTLLPDENPDYLSRQLLAFLRDHGSGERLGAQTDQHD